MSPSDAEERERQRTEALRDLSRAQRQLLAALLAVEVAEPRERAAAGQALEHAEARVTHALSALDALTRRAAAGEAVGPQGAREPDATGAGRRTPATRGGPSGGEVDDYVEELAQLARQCALDVEDLRAMLEAAAGGQGPGTGPATARGEAGGPAEASEPGAPPAVVRHLARQAGEAALDDLHSGLAAIASRLEAVARGRALEGGRQVPESGGAAGALRATAARLEAIEERLGALERRVRWIEAAGHDRPAG